MLRLNGNWTLPSSAARPEGARRDSRYLRSGAPARALDAACGEGVIDGPT